MLDALMIMLCAAFFTACFAYMAGCEWVLANNRY